MTDILSPAGRTPIDSGGVFIAQSPLQVVGLAGENTATVRCEFSRPCTMSVTVDGVEKGNNATFERLQSVSLAGLTADSEVTALAVATDARGAVVQVGPTVFRTSPAAPTTGQVGSAPEVLVGPATLELPGALTIQDYGGGVIEAQWKDPLTGTPDRVEVVLDGIVIDFTTSNSRVLNGLAAGTHEVRVRRHEVNGDHSDWKIVTVETLFEGDTGPAASADAGPDRSVTAGEEFTITGVANDPVGAIANTRWLEGVTEVSDSGVLTVTIPTASTVTYTFEVTDSRGTVITDTVDVTAVAATAEYAGPTLLNCGDTYTSATGTFSWNTNNPPADMRFHIYLDGIKQGNSVNYTTSSITTDTVPTVTGTHTMRLYYWPLSQGLDPNDYVECDFEVTGEAPPVDPPPVDPPPDPAPSGGSTAILSGYGTGSDFGNNGRTITVTNLNDSGAGSFRDAITQSGARKVVFNVEGVIPADTPLVPSNGALTVLGSTAPGKGVFVQATPGNATYGFRTNHTDMLFENMGFLHSVSSGNSLTARDSVSVSPGSRRVCFSQCTMAWGSDETIQIWGSKSTDVISDITFQYCIVAEGLSNTGHPSGEHSKGLHCGYRVRNVSIHHCWFASNTRRNPRLHADCGQIVNNIVVCNNADDGTQFRGIAIGSAYQSQRFDVVSNLVDGDEGEVTGCHIYNDRVMEDLGGAAPRVHGKGNIGPRRPNNSLPESDFFEHFGSATTRTISSTPYCSPNVITHTDATGNALRDHVRSLVGNHSWNRHALNIRLLAIQPNTAGTVNAPPEGIMY